MRICYILAMHSTRRPNCTTFYSDFPLSMSRKLNISQVVDLSDSVVGMETGQWAGRSDVLILSRYGIYLYCKTTRPALGPT